ncbi:MAG: hydroxyisourate hydrolase [Archangium sp.]|nr:hydroxyisourate hydrolase [Archangium sp.]
MAITTHILDTTLGKPAKGVPIELHKMSGDAMWKEVGKGATDDDGRLKTLTPAGPIEPGTYRIRFDTGAYFKATATKGFYPYVEVVFEIVDGGAHYHVPLLLNPWGFSTYRGS